MRFVFQSTAAGKMEPSLTYRYIWHEKQKSCYSKMLSPMSRTHGAEHL